MSHISTITDGVVGGNPRRRILSAVVGAILQESGFHSAEKAAVGTLTEILQSLLTEIGRTSKMYCEVAYRSEPVIGDLILSFADQGIKIDGLQAYAKRSNRMVITTPSQQMDNKQSNILQVGDKKPHLSHIPDNLPSFPDTHTYCFSHTYKQPVTEYEAIREKSALQKRDIERALTKFGSKTNDINNLFYGEDKDYLLMAIKPTPKAFYDALMPRDQVFEEDEEYHAKLKRRRKEEIDEEGNSVKEKDKDTSEQEVDNPYLRAVKMPRKKNKHKS